MLPADRFRAWIDSLSEDWKDRLRGWMASWLMQGFDELVGEQEPQIIGLTKDTLDKIKATPGIPPELLAMLEKATTTGDLVSVIFGWMMTVIGAIPAMFGLGAPLGRSWEYTQERAIKSYRLDPATVNLIWLRDKAAYEKHFEDLRDQGWDEDRIAVAQELSNIIPPLADMVRFADYSSFDPEVIAKWRQFYDAPGWISDPFALLGVTGEWANKYWFSHWVQPGRYELSLMHRRGLINDDDVKLAYRTMGYSPYWQDLLLDLVKEVPTRVDVRRWWDMRTIDEAELRDIYHRQGYYGKDLDNYVLWTKVYVAFPDLMARWSKGWITIDNVRGELTSLGMPPDRVEEMIQTKIEPASGDRVANERDLTKTDIIKGVKKEVISWSEGVELLVDMGYSEDEADYILTINISAATGSPESYVEFKDITQKYRKVAGMPNKPITEELKKAAAEVVRLTRDVKALGEAVTTEERSLVAGKILPESATSKLSELKVSLHRAESELSAARTNYDVLIARWRHGS